MSIFIYIGVITGLKLGLTFYLIELEDENLQNYVDTAILVVASPWFYLMYLPIVSWILTLIIGKYALSAILYPY